MNVSSVTQNPPTITATQSGNTVNGPSILNDQTPIANAPNISNQNPSGGNSKSLSIQCNEIGEVLTFSGTGLSPTTQTYICSHAATNEPVILTFANNIVTSSSNSITVSSVDPNGNPTTNNSSFILPIDNQRPIVTVTAGPNIIQGDDATFTITVNDGSSFTPFTPQISQGTITSDQSSGQCSASPCQMTVSGTSVGNLNLIVPSGTVVDAAGNTNILSSTASLNVRASNLSVNSLPRATSLNASSYPVLGSCESTQGSVTVTIGTPNIAKTVGCNSGNYLTTFDVSSVTANPMIITAVQSTNEASPSVAPENDQTGPISAPTATAPSGPINGSSYNLSIICNEAGEIVQITGSGLNPSIQTYTCSNSGAENFTISLAQNIETTNPNNLTISSSDQYGNQADSTTQVNVPIDTKAPVVSITTGGNLIIGDDAIFTIIVTEGNSFTPFTPQVNRGAITSGQCSSSPCQVTVSGANVGSLNLIVSSGTVIDAAGNTNILSSTASLNVRASNLSVNSLPRATSLNASSYPVSGSCESTQGSVTVTIGTPNIAKTVGCNSGNYLTTFDVSSVTANPMIITAVQSTNEAGPSVAPENDQTGPISAPTATSPSGPINGSSYDLPIICNEAGEVVQITDSGLNPSIQTYTCSNSGAENFTISLAQNIETTNPNNLTISSSDQYGNQADSTTQVNVPIDTKAPIISITSNPSFISGDNVVFTITISDGNSFLPFVPNSSSGIITSGQCLSSPCTVTVGGASVGTLSLTVNTGSVVDIAGNNNTTNAVKNTNIIVSNLSIDNLLYVGASNASNYSVSGNCESTQGNVTVIAGTPNVSEDVVSCSGGNYSATLDVTSVTSTPMAVSVSQSTNNIISSIENDTCFSFTFNGSEVTVTSYLSANIAGESCSTNVVIPDRVTNIGDEAFKDKALTSVEFPEGLMTIGASAFQGNNLTSILIPESVVSIGDNAFDGNPDLEFVVFTNPGPTIGTDAFSNGHAVETEDVCFEFSATDTNQIKDYYDNEGNSSSNPVCPRDVVIPQGVTSIKDGAFFEKVLTSVIIPDGVTSIGNHAFTTNGLTSVTIPDSVTSIEGLAFAFNDLTSVTIPDSVTSIGNHAFQFNALTSVTISDGVTSIGDYAFQENALTSVTIPDSVTSIGESAFQNNELTSVTISDRVTSIRDGAFSGNDLTSVIIPDGVTSIGDYAFSTNKLTSVTIPDSVTSIGDYAFFYNELGSVIIGSGVTSIEDDAFANNSSLTSVCIEAQEASIDFGTTPFGSLADSAISYESDGDCTN